MRFSFRLIFPLAALLFAQSVYAATLTVTPDNTSFLPGETVTLTVTGTINPTIDLAPNIDVRLALGGGITFLSSTADQALNPPPMFGPQTGWTVGGTEGTESGNSVTVFNQIQGLPPGGPFVNNFNGVDSAFITATVLVTLNGPGVFHIGFGPLTNFFGLSTGPAITLFTPEPATATLVALGLLGLATTRRG